jgi:hypothetical protein
LVNLFNVRALSLTLEGMMIVHRSTEGTVAYDATRRTSRRCGDCQLCCKLIPVEEFGKRANQRCRHQKAGKGCAIYPQRPLSCALWNCRWLVDSDAAELPRPDRAHYVLDMMPDFVVLSDEPTDKPANIPVIQVWTDPAYPDTHRAPSLRAWLDRQKSCALIRYGSREGFVIAPPSLTGSRWLELQSKSSPRPPHPPDEIAAALGEGSDEMLMADIVADIERIER